MSTNYEDQELVKHLTNESKGRVVPCFGELKLLFLLLLVHV